MSGIFILLGSNLGEKLVNLREARIKLEEQGCVILEKSSVYETEPWGVAEQPWFLNILLEIDFDGSAHDLLKICLQVEKNMGRERIIKWGERLIDVDILYFRDEIIDTDDLKIPHPGIPDRRFVLIPLSEKWPDYTHHISSERAQDMLEKTNDTLKCNRTDLNF